jgi:ketosteroid isomerase-like protein
MPLDRVEAVRAIYDGWARGDFTAGVDLYDPMILLVQGDGFAEPGPYLGTEGVRRYMTTFLEAWERVAIRADDLTEAGDSVLAEVTQRAVGKESGADAPEWSYFQLWTFRGDRVIRLDVIRERADALAAAGIPE